MPFNPIFNNIAPQLIRDGLREQAEREQRNKELQQKQLMDGLKMAGQAIGQAGEQYQQRKELAAGMETARKSDLGRRDAMLSSGMLDAEMAAKLKGISDPAELSGAMSVFEKQMGRQQESRVGQTLDVEDPRNPGNPRRYVYASDNNIVPVESGASGPPKTMATANGMMQYNQGAQRFEYITDPDGNVVKPNPSGDPFMNSLLRGGMPQGSAPGSLPSAPAPGAMPSAPAGPTISVDEASRRLGRPVASGTQLRDNAGNIITVR